ncbi:FMN-linked oxidoreductase [Setomelanomma holmii]|uniref:FMN-linked oxidoreductase n=1 Tax=Setomelanomma holmii TaxID=210430 RepID=A0A9P4HB85_9PLEO|nr:FMN-linked oxidoreductase [Setomelanomma holmii]
MATMRKLSDPVQLPSGVVFRNRLVKAAMAEHMTKTHTPTDEIPVAYKNWGKGGWGGILTGNVQLDDRWLGGKNDLTFTNSSNPDVQARWRQYADACRVEGTPAIVQVCHPGRQSPMRAGSRGLLEKNIAPSAVPLKLGENLASRVVQKVVFGTPREMTVEEINDLVKRFADAAKFLSEMGVDGIELHAAHGYLLSLFMSPRLNHRADAYGGSPTNRVRIITEIIHAIRAIVPATFAVGIKLNSADVQHSNDTAEAIEQIHLIIAAGIDFLEISGGTYEDPRMTGRAESQVVDKPVSSRTANREAYFLDFAHTVRKQFPGVVLMVTGGFRSLAGMEAALAENACDVIGVARPAAVDPAWARILLAAEKEGREEVLRLNKVHPGWLMSKIPVRAIGAGAEWLEPPAP